MLILATSLLWIILRDIAKHRISNLSILVLSIIMIVTSHCEVHWRAGLIAFIILIAVFHIADLGGGDAKLITALSLFNPVKVSASSYIAMALLIGVVIVLLHLLKDRRISGNIALAPAICGPLLVAIF